MTSFLPVGILLTSSIIITSGVPVPECCSLISGLCGSACEQISLVSIALDPQERQFRLWTLHQYCDKELTKFWQCFNQSLSEIQQGEEWIGRPCCKLPQSQTCRYACLKAQVKSDLFQECRRSDEIGFFSCVEQLEVGEKCCSNAQTVECHQACQHVFASKQTPNGKTRNAVTHSCSYHSPKVVKCVQDYVRMTPSNNPQRNLHCCDKSSDEHCTKACIHALRTKKTDQDIVDAIEAACGPPSDYAKLDKMWQCFLRHANSPRSRSTSISSINRMGLDSAKLQCCRKAVSVTCRKLCFKTFNNEWASNWDAFDKQCQSDSNELELSSCLAEVDEPCELGCEGLTYCTNFNDRPTELFQSCSSTADRAAQKDVSLWKSRYITMPNMQIPVVDITRCDPNMWKAVACTLQLKPCRPHRPTATICKSDCISILTKCLDYDRLPMGISADTLCNEVLAPTSDDDDTCISLKPYMGKSPEAVNALQVTHPCHPNPCNVSEVCIVTRYCTPGQVCLPYKCEPGCRMGDISLLVVPKRFLVSIPLMSITVGCQKICKCSENLQVEECLNGPCIEHKHCWNGNKRIEHGQVFDSGCNKCICFSGEITCTKFACELKQFTAPTGLPCNCAAHHVPMCGANGQTYASACLAKCANLQENQMDFGSCNSLNPCSTNPCLPYQRCVSKKTVCLSINRKPCHQYECIPVNNDCALQSLHPVCDINNKQYPNLCYLLKNNSIIAYRGPCLSQCKRTGIVCGHNGETYSSECAARADRISIDYQGPCIAIGTDNRYKNDARCKGVECPTLKVKNCIEVVPPGACCPICGGGLQVLYSHKHADYLLSSLVNQIEVREIGEHLVGYVQSAECDLFAYLSISGSLVVLIVPITISPTLLQTQVCATEAEKLASLITHDNPLLLTDVLLSPLKSAQILHTPGSPSSANYLQNCKLDYLFYFTCFVFYFGRSLNTLLP